MAGRKEYEMLFKLMAETGSNFNSAFGRAAAAISSLQNDIQALNALQGDISAYQRQQAGIEETQKKLALLQQQYDNIQREIQETGTYSSSLQNALLSKQQQIDKTSASLEKQTQKLNGMEAELKEAGIDTGNLTSESKRLETEMEQLKEAQMEAAASAEHYGISGQEALEAVSSAMVSLGLAKAFGELKDAMMECVNVSGELEASMSNVEALSGAGVDDMNALTEQAKELGATTKFTAKESADAMGYMAMAGWDAQEMMSGMSGVLSLAAASGEDLAQTSDIVTDNLTAFGLTAADTSRFADVLAAAASNSNTSVAVMGETFRNCASIAGALGYSIEDVSVAVGLMANAGVKGGNAGTGLKNIFNGLLEGVTLTSAAFGTMEFSAIKADGTMRSFSETVNALRGYFSQMTEAERVNNAMAIAGSRAYNGLLAIINASDEDYASLTDSINNCTGAAERMAKVKMDNLQGDMTLMNSAADALKTTIGDQLNPSMRKLYQFGTEVYQMLNEFVQKNPALVKAVMAFVGIVGTAIVALTSYAAIVKVIKALDLATLFTGPVGVIMGVVAGVAALTAAIVACVDEANAGIPALEELTEAARGLDDAVAESTKGYEDAMASAAASASLANRYIDKLEELGSTSEMTGTQQREYNATLSLLCQTVPELSSLINTQTGEIKGGTAALRAHTAAWEADAKAQARQKYLAEIQEQYGNVLLEQAKNEVKLTEAKVKTQAAEKGIEEAKKRQLELLKEAGIQSEKLVGYEMSDVEVTNALSDEYFELDKAIDAYNQDIRDGKREQEQYIKAIEEDAAAVAKAQEETEIAEKAVDLLNSGLASGADISRLSADGYETVSAAIESTMLTAQKLTEAYNEAYEAALTSVGGQYEIWDQAKDVVAVGAGTINSALESQISYWNDYNANLTSLRERSSDIEGLSDVIASFADGSEESVNAIAGMASASDTELAEMVSNYQTLQAAQEETSGSIADLVTDYSAQMDTLGANLAEDIAAMDMSSEAAAAGQATIEAYVNAAAAMEGRVAAAYSRIGKAAAKALQDSMANVSVSMPGVAHDAAGTKSADPGLAVVGENGPELVVFNGGEQVINARETAALINAAAARTEAYERGAGVTQASTAEGAQPAESSGNATPSVTVQFNIDGSPSESVIEQLREYGADFAERVREVLEDIMRDEKRRAYA